MGFFAIFSYWFNYDIDTFGFLDLDLTFLFVAKPDGEDEAIVLPITRMKIDNSNKSDP